MTVLEVSVNALVSKRFSVADRHGVLCLVASPNSNTGSLQVHQDVRIYSSILEPGRHVIHALPKERCAWIHVVQGGITANETELVTGDGAGIIGELTVSFTAREQTEILLLDFGGKRSEPPKNRDVS